MLQRQFPTAKSTYISSPTNLLSLIYSSEARGRINNRDILSIIKFVLAQTREKPSVSSHLATCKIPKSRFSSEELITGKLGLSSVTTGPSIFLGSDTEDIFHSLQAIKLPGLSSEGVTCSKVAMSDTVSYKAYCAMALTMLSEPTPAAISPSASTKIGKIKLETPYDKYIWSLGPTHCSAATDSFHTKLVPPTLWMNSVSAATTIQAVQDHTLASKSDLSVYSHGGESSSGGLTSFPKLRRRRSSQWTTPDDMMDRQYTRPMNGEI